MPRRGPTTTQRGYGGQHQAARAWALSHYQQGQPCTRCGQAMWETDPRSLHLDHSDDRTHYLGLAHPTCNTRAGQAKAMRGRQPIDQQTETKRSRNW